jgi:cytochrome o ubiquinol oxidase subunit II
MMRKKYRIPLFILLLLGVVLSVMLYINRNNIAVLNPIGIIALKQRSLLIISTLLMLIVVIPVFVLTFIFAWKYRASKKAKYTPDWDDNKVAEFIWWGVPCLIILVMSVLTWKNSHELDPFRPLNETTKPITIQVVALQWKWLFIYPEQNIASVNFFQFPEKTPLNFEITSDAPMNSFWIPKLGGQIYAMPGMRTKLHLIADEVGSFRGVSANLSGKGFASMSFIAKSSSQGDFDRWVGKVKQSSPALGLEQYNQLAKPSEDNPAITYLLKEEHLFDQIVMKYMAPPKELTNDKQ